MTLPPFARTKFVPNCVSVLVRYKTENGKEGIGWYGFLSKTWWRENNGKGQQLTVPVVSWEKIK